MTVLMLVMLCRKLSLCILEAKHIIYAGKGCELFSSLVYGVYLSVKFAM